MSEKKNFCWKEIVKHNSDSDCWIVCHEKVYDVTKFISAHPGGDLIYLNAGKDCTQLFESYHPTTTWNAIKSFYIGDVSDTGSHFQQGTKFIADPQHAEFYRVVKQRVEGYMKDNQIRPRDHPLMYLKSFSIIAMFIVSYLCTLQLFLMSTNIGGWFNFSGGIAFAIVQGLLMACIGINITHDANHGGYSNSKLVTLCFSTLMDIIGFSSFFWKQGHDVGHHVFTNVDSVDPDIRIADPDVRRITATQPFHAYHKFQHLYLPVLYSLLALYRCFIDDAISFTSKKIGRVEFRDLNTKELIQFFFGKIAFLTYMVAIPLIFGLPVSVVLLWMVSAELAAGCYFAYVFEVGHVVVECDTPVCGEKKLIVNREWGVLQASCTIGFSHNNWLADFLTGGLNYQIEHHLFPSTCHLVYPKIAPIVRKTCEEYGVTYTVFPSFFDAASSHIQLLRHFGSGSKAPFVRKETKKQKK